LKKLNLSFLVVLVLVIISTPVIAEKFRTSGPDIKVTLISQDPDPVKQGEILEVRFKIENNGTQTNKNLFIEILPEYPFSLYSANKRKIGQLRSLQTGADAVIVDFKLKVDEKAVEGDNEIKIKVYYEDGDVIGIKEDDFKVDVEKYDLPEIRAYVRESDLLKSGKTGKVVIEIANSDIGDAKFVQLTLNSSDQYQILSRSNYVYLGDVDSDDTESEEFEIYVFPSIEDAIFLPVTIQYQDINEQRYEEHFVLKLEIYTSSELKKFGLEKRSYILPVVIILILLLSAYIYWRQVKK
jgi:hypothetical protein